VFDVINISSSGVYKLFQANFIYIGVGLHLFIAQPTFFLLGGSEFIHELGNTCIMKHLQIIGMGTLHTITQRMYQIYYALWKISNLLLIILFQNTTFRDAFCTPL
jgi:hypothetical protein